MKITYLQNFIDKMHLTEGIFQEKNFVGGNEGVERTYMYGFQSLITIEHTP